MEEKDMFVLTQSEQRRKIVGEKRKARTEAEGNTASEESVGSLKSPLAVSTYEMPAKVDLFVLKNLLHRRANCNWSKEGWIALCHEYNKMVDPRFYVSWPQLIKGTMALQKIFDSQKECGNSQDPTLMEIFDPRITVRGKIPEYSRDYHPSLKDYYFDGPVNTSVVNVSQSSGKSRCRSDDNKPHGRNVRQCLGEQDSEPLSDKVLELFADKCFLMVNSGHLTDLELYCAISKPHELDKLIVKSVAKDHPDENLKTTAFVLIQELVTRKIILPKGAGVVEECTGVQEGD